MNDFVRSPCVSVCEMDEARGLCRGCLRTLDEIGHWLEYSPAEKRAVLERIEERKNLMVDGAAPK
jgi:predicted Fe-S protein YdhL (DUF1289 family)